MAQQASDRPREGPGELHRVVPETHLAEWRDQGLLRGGVNENGRARACPFFCHFRAWTASYRKKENARGRAFMIQFGEETCGDVDAALRKEWLETNGLGGFASSTIIGLNTRRYHGLLVAATKPPVGRV